MKHIKLFSTAALATLILCGCGAAPISSSSETSSEEKASSSSVLSSKTTSSEKKSSSTTSSKSSSKSSSSSSSSSKAPHVEYQESGTSTAPVVPSPLDAEGKHPATGQVPQKEMSNAYLRLFSPDAKPQISLTFDKDTLYDMSRMQYDRNNRKLFDVYFPANFKLVLDGVTYQMDEVGVRLKGNWSRHQIVDQNGNFRNHTHLKISFKARFDDRTLYNSADGTAKYFHDWTGKDAEKTARKNRTLFGMEKIDLKVVPRNDGSMAGQGTADNACISREVYCYDAFRDQNLLSPYANIASVNLSNGLWTQTAAYELVECVDKAYLQKRFSKNDAAGNLYKCAKNVAGVRANFETSNAIDTTGGSSGNAPLDAQGFEIGKRLSKTVGGKEQGIIGVEDCYNGYDPVYQLKTNDGDGETDMADLADVIAKMHSIVNFNIPQNDKYAMVEQLVDTDYFCKFSAVSYLLGGIDDQRNAGNNFYLYFVPSTNKMIYIAYDWDWCMGPTSCFDSKGAYSEIINFNPLDTWTAEGGSDNKTNWPSGTLDKTYEGYKNNIYWATFLPVTKGHTATLGYTATYQNWYLNYVNNLKGDVLDNTKFTTLNSTYRPLFPTLKLSGENTGVTKYMTAKKSALTTYFGSKTIPDALPLPGAEA